MPGKGEAGKRLQLLGVFLTLPHAIRGRDCSHFAGARTGSERFCGLLDVAQLVTGLDLGLTSGCLSRKFAASPVHRVF